MGSRSGERPGAALAQRQPAHSGGGGGRQGAGERVSADRLRAAEEAHDTAYEKFRGAAVDAGFQATPATNRSYAAYARAREDLRAARTALGVADTTHVTQQQALAAAERQYSASGAGSKTATDSQRLRASLAYEERAIARQPLEHAAALRANGEVYMRAGGLRRMGVDFSDSQLPGLKGGILTHNHPRGQAFSDVDVEFAKRTQLAEMRVSSVGYRYSLRPPKAGWGSVSLRRISAALSNAQREVKTMQTDMARNGRGASLERLNANYWHEVMTRVAKATGIQYSRTTWSR